MRHTIAAFCLAFSLIASTSAADADPREVGCGGFPLYYGTSFAWTGPPSGHQLVSGVTAVAAVTKGDDLHALGWVVWDESGQGWLGLAQTSPPELRAMWTSPTPPTYHGPGIQVRFEPFKRPLPKTYQLTDCPQVLSFQE